jgi:hypothetical protein
MNGKAIIEGSNFWKMGSKLGVTFKLKEEDSIE